MSSAATRSAARRSSAYWSKGFLCVAAERRRDVNLKKSKTKEGASLIELVVVLAGCLILVIGAGQFVGNIQRFAARAELALLALTIRTEQQKALLTGTERTVTFNDDGSGYVTDTSTHQFQRGVLLGAPPGALGPPSAPHKPIIKPVTMPDQKLICYPQGIIQVGTVYLAMPAYQQYYALTSSVAQYSFLRLYQYRLNWIAL